MTGDKEFLQIREVGEVRTGGVTCGLRFPEALGEDKAGKRPWAWCMCRYREEASWCQLESCREHVAVKVPSVGLQSCTGARPDW